MNKEIWKTLSESDNYLVSNTGKIKSLNYKRTGIEKELKQNINSRGYPYVFISKNSKYKNILIHQAVAKAFIPNPNNLPQVNHIDGDKTNNKVENLEWCNNRENIKHAYKNGLRGKQVGNTYKKRCELAIEYINNSWTGGYTDTTLKYKVEEINITELLEILKDSDVDE